MMSHHIILATSSHVSHVAPNVEGWLGFFGAVAGASVTLFSVMFVTFQVKSHIWNSSSLKRITALAALFELLIPLFVALIALMGGHPWTVGAWISGGLGIFVVFIHWYLYLWGRGAHDQGFDKQQAWGAWISFVVYSLMITGGALADSVGLYLVGGTSIWLLFSGAMEAWWHLEPKVASVPPSR